MNKRKLITASSLFVSLFALLLSCDKKVGKLPTSTTPPPVVGACDTITYVKHIKPIIDASCISCHGNPLSGGATVFLTNYAEVKASADNGTLKADVVDGTGVSMPYGTAPLPQAQKDLVSCWINNGKKQQ